MNAEVCHDKNVHKTARRAPESAEISCHEIQMSSEMNKQLFIATVIWSLLALIKLSDKFRNKADIAEWQSNYCFLCSLISLMIPSARESVS
jgi:hypothetical protein